tara:strand:+ start:917 stop:2506 length:1590 start_codon:yes stop_codon:yes gene_type:complete
MAKESKFVGLDAKAMFQAGAAGAGGKTTQKDSNIVSKIGQYALGYYMKAADNMKEARMMDSKLFAQVEAFALESDLITPDITKIKNDLTEANKTLNSVRGMLLPNSEKMIEAQKKRDKALADITKLSVDFGNFKEVNEYQQKLAAGQYTVQLDSGEQAVAGYGNGNTAIQMYNSSLIVNGQLQKSLRVQDGELWVDYTDNGMYEGGSWDNPDTEEIETKPKSIRLKDMEFATHANPNQAQLSNDYIMQLTSLGAEGKLGGDLSASGMDNRMKNDLTNEFNKMGNKARVDYLFDKAGWIDGEGNSHSLIDQYIKTLQINAEGIGDQEEDQTGIDDPSYVEFTEYDENMDGVLSINEINGAKEIIKQKILDGSYKTDGIVNMIHDEAVSKYNSSYKQYEEILEQRKQENKTTPQWKVLERRTRKERVALLDDIKSGERIDFGVNNETNRKTTLIYKTSKDHSKTGNYYQTGWHLSTWKDGKWMVGTSLGNELQGPKDSKTWVPMFLSHEDVVNYFRIHQKWPADWEQQYNW